MSKQPIEEEKDKFMKRAVEASRQGASSGGWPYGAVIVRGGEVIAESANKVSSDFDPTAHAEVSAIRKACKELKTTELTGCHIYASCYPCKMCMAAIYWARIEAIYFAITPEEYPPYLNYVDHIMKALDDDASKLNEERTVYQERVLSQADAAYKVGKDWVLKRDKL